MAASNNFIISTLNVNGLRDHQKQKDMLNFLREQKSDIYFLQETHITLTSENYFRSVWGYNLWVAGADTNRNGVAIMFSPTFEYKIKEIIRDRAGSYIIIDVEMLQKRVTLVNIYGPSTGDNPLFFEKVYEIINEIGNDVNIIGGDWNCVLNAEIDTINYTNTRARPRSRAKILSSMSEFDLVDAFRELYPNKKEYTWRRFNTNKRGRLDYFLVSKDLMGEVKETKICPGYRTDHSLVKLTLRRKAFEKDRPYWKFNNSLLKDKCYVEKIKNKIDEIKTQYAIPVYNLDKIKEIGHEDMTFTISDQLFLETLLMEIRGKTISYASFVKKKETEMEKNLMETIKTKEKESNLSEYELIELERTKNQLEHLRRKKTEGMMIRSRVKWITDGDKPTKYFCNLENRNFTNRSVSFLEKTNGDIVDEQTSILREVEQDPFGQNAELLCHYCSDLYYLS